VASGKVGADKSTVSQIDYDPFLFMERNNKVYGWTMALYEYRRTVESLWQNTRDFAKLHPEYIHPDNALKGFMIDDESKDLQDGDWNSTQPSFLIDLFYLC
jgi:alpha 1,2-mannosyltransferase